MTRTVVSKKVLVVIAGSRAGTAAGASQTRDVQVEVVQETTAKDILRKIEVVDGILKHPSTAYTFGENERVFDRVETGDKLHAVPRTPVAS